MQPSAERFAYCRAVVLQLSWPGRYLAPERRQELEAEELSAFLRPAVSRVADQRAVAHLQVLSVRRLRREAVSFRRQAACPEVHRQAASLRQQAGCLRRAGSGAHPEVSWSRHLHRADVHPDAPSALRRPGASLWAFRPEARRLMARSSKERWSKALWSAPSLWWAAYR